MHDKKVKVIYFSLRDSKSKAFELSGRYFVALLSVVVVAVFLVFSVFLSVFTSFYQNLELASLTKQNEQLTTELSGMGERLLDVESRVNGLEREDDDLRIIANLPILDSDTRKVGIGGFNNTTVNASFGNEGLSDQVNNYQSILDQVERRLDLTISSRQAIREKLEADREMMKHIPSVKPLLNGRLNDRFGLRMHPIYSKLKRHEGVDIAAPEGSEVFAAAAGVVTKVVAKYKRNVSYGKHVIIDHGYGLSTLYGHMSRVLVKQGQKIDRWTPIGLVGQTGAATGPHLHYEVRKNNQPQDPMSYILDIRSGH